MHFDLEIKNDGLIKELDRLAKSVPQATPKAVDAMSEVIRPALIAAAPYDGRRKNRRDKHLKEVIKQGTTFRLHNGAQTSIWLKPRGVRGAKQGPKASKNWDADKQIYKLVVAEFGRSNQKAKPFWEPTVDAKADAAVNAAISILKKEIEK